MNSLKLIRSLGKNAFLFIFGQTISRIGDMAQLTGLTIYVYNVSSNIFSVSILYAVEALSMIIFGQIGGLFADKMERKRSLVILQILQSLLIALIPFSGTGVFLYFLFFIFTACTSISRIFQSAMSGDIVDSEHYQIFQGIYSSLQSLSLVIGPVIGAWIFSAFGKNALFIFNALSFIICAITTVLISIPWKNVEAKNNKDLLSEWKEGYKIVLSNSDISAIVFSMPIIMFAVGILNSIFVGINKDLWQFSDKQFGWMMAAGGIGGILGGIIYGVINSKFSLKSSFYFGILVKAFCLLVSTFIFNFYLVFLLFIINRIGFSFMTSTAQVLLLKMTSQQERGRVISIANSLASILMLFGSSVSGFLVKYTGYKISMTIVIAFHLLCAFIFYLFSNKSSKNIFEFLT